MLRSLRARAGGRLEHTWQFEPLARSAAITPNWLWRLAVSPKADDGLPLRRCVSAGNLVAAGGGKDSSGTIDVDDKVKDLGMQLKRGKGAREMSN